MKVTVLLRNDHEALKALFSKLTKPSGIRKQNGKKDGFEEIRREILLHSQMEQEIFYPALRATSSTRASELVSQAEQEHESVEQMLQELKAMNGSEKDFETRLTALMDAVISHIEMEENEIFDEARKNLPEFRLEELGLDIEERRKILTTLAA